MDYQQLTMENGQLTMRGALIEELLCGENGVYPTGSLSYCLSDAYILSKDLCF